MTTGRAFLVAFGLILAGGFFIGSWIRKQVTLVIDGESSSRETYAVTTGGFLRSIGITLSEGDSLVPSQDHWLRDGDTIAIDRAFQVIILADGKTHRLTTLENIPANLLLQAGIPLFPGDLLYNNGKEIAPEDELPHAPVYALHLKRAGQVTLRNGSSSQTFSTNAITLGEALWEAGIEVNAKDVLSLPLDTPLQSQQVVTLHPSKEVSFKTAGELMKSRSAAKTVGAALAESGLPLQGLDYSSPAMEEEVPGDGFIRVVRVKEDVLLETTTIPFETKTQPVADLELDQQSVVDEGKLGLNIRRNRVRTEDGKEVSRRLEGEYTALEPKPRILGYGTKVVPHTLDTSDGPIKYWRALNMYAVSYNHTSNGGTGTASGIPLAKGVAAIDINYIPFYTQMYIPGYGRAVAADVGGGVQGRMIDLGYSDSDYVSWHQWVTVYFLWPPPETIPWIFP
jgi:resuscitation-promoting factor RpfB